MPDLSLVPPRQILETVLYVDDLQAAELFYRETLGLEVHSHKPGIFCFFKLAKGMLLLFDARASRQNSEVPAHGADGPGHVCFAIEEERLDAWKARLQQAGVEIEHEQEWPRGGRSFYFRDPAGNSLEMAPPRIWALPES
jgi:catechol 2,3-dioxygenase-like lactoylglutathione lyase family enzyme